MTCHCSMTAHVQAAVVHAKAPKVLTNECWTRAGKLLTESVDARASLQVMAAQSRSKADAEHVQLHIALDEKSLMQAKIDERDDTIAEQQAQLTVLQQQLDDCRMLLKSRVRWYPWPLAQTRLALSMMIASVHSDTALVLGVDVSAGLALTPAARKYNKDASCCRGFPSQMTCSCRQPSGHATVTAR